MLRSNGQVLILFFNLRFKSLFLVEVNNMRSMQLRFSVRKWVVLVVHSNVEIKNNLNVHKHKPNIGLCKL